jgi:hypothetical protein
MRENSVEPVVAAVAVVAIKATDPKLREPVVPVKVVHAREERLLSTTTTSPHYEEWRHRLPLKKVTVKCLRHCLSESSFTETNRPKQY